MKKIIFVITIAIAAVCSFTGCEKEDMSQTKGKTYNALPKVLQELYDQMPARNYGNITVIDGNILCFESKEQYENVARQLMEDCRIWDNLFLNAYNQLSSDSLSDFEEKIGYSEFVPLQMFEEHYGVSGRMLFDEQQVIEQQWLDSGMPGKDPTDDIFILESDQAMFNVNHEICVDDTIYQFREDAIILIPISRLEQWRQYRLSPTSELPTIFIVISDNPKIDNTNISHHNFVCKDGDHLYSSDFNVIEQNNRSDWKVKGRRGFGCSHVAAFKLVNYERKTRKNGTHYYRKIRLFCSIIPHIIFTTEEYEQMYQSFQNFYFDYGHMDDTIPANINVRCNSGKIQYNQLGINYLSHSYRFGCADDANVVIRIGNVDPVTYPIQWNN